MKGKHLKGILLDLLTLALCITAIFVGVFSVKNANLNISGEIGFEKHEPFTGVAKAVGKITGAKNATGANTFYLNPDENSALTSPKTMGVEQLDSQIVAQFGELSFADDSTPVSFNIEITSATDDPIVVDVDFESFNFENVSKTMSTDYLNFITSNGKTTNISFTLSKQDFATTSTFSGSLKININKASNQTATDAGYTVEAVDDYYNITGLPSTSQTDASITIPAYFYDSTTKTYKKVNTLKGEYDDDMGWYRAVTNAYNYSNIIFSNGISEIYTRAFNGVKVQTISLPSSLKTIGNSAFRYATSLESITLSSGVEEIGEGTFSDSGLKSFTSNHALINLQGLGNCYELTNVVLKNGLKTIGSHAFEMCSSLTNIELPDKLEAIGDYAFSSCDKLTSLPIIKDVKTMGKYIFSNCIGFVSIEVPNTMLTIPEYFFNACTNLVSIKLPETLESIGANAFLYCSALTEISIPKNVKLIGKEAFNLCSKLTSITFDSSMQTGWKYSSSESGPWQQDTQYNSDFTNATSNATRFRENDTDYGFEGYNYGGFYWKHD